MYHFIKCISRVIISMLAIMLLCHLVILFYLIPVFPKHSRVAYYKFPWIKFQMSTDTFLKSALILQWLVQGSRYSPFKSVVENSFKSSFSWCSPFWWNSWWNNVWTSKFHCHISWFEIIWCFRASSKGIKLILIQ